MNTTQPPTPLLLQLSTTPPGFTLVQPPNMQVATKLNATEAISVLHRNEAILWRGDYHQGVQLFHAIKRRLRAKRKTPRDFHTHRMQQAQISRHLSGFLLAVKPGGVLENSRAPDIQTALLAALDTLPVDHFLLPLNLLLGFIGAHEWEKKGVSIQALNGKNMHVPFGVFSPLRGEYLDLIAQQPLPDRVQVAFDIGTGSGVIAAILAARGVAHITATETNPRAIRAAKNNLALLGFTAQVTVLNQDLFPNAKADLIVCNPPWLPAKPSSALETALYDAKHAMLQSFLFGARKHLNPSGQVWLIMSDLAEHLGLREPGALPAMFKAANLQLISQTTTHAVHPKAQDTSDVLHFARSREVTSLWCLRANQDEGGI